MAIFCNQVGYLNCAKKIAAMTEGKQFKVIRKDAEGTKIVLEKDAVLKGLDQASQDTVLEADFSEIWEDGVYYIENELGQKSHSFRIGKDVYKVLQNDLIKALYFQRCGCALEEKYAGIYKHDCCHTAEVMLWDDHSVKKEVNGGWHDAGDFGRYISPAAVAVGHLLYAYKLFPESLQGELNIPETGNGVPDILNECRYELEWMLKMQDEEGGAYHKVTAQYHADFLMPEEDKDPFYLYPVSSMATADYAASMALASRIYREFDKDFADRLFDAAKKASDWLEKYPEYLGFKNPKDSGTGEYGDFSDRDERLWAAAEMLITTGDQKYQDIMNGLLKEDMSFTDFGWVDVSGFAALALLTDKTKAADDDICTFLTKKVYEEADRLVALSKESGYGVAMQPEDYVWGSNMVVLNRGMLLVFAALLAKESGDDTLISKVNTYEETALCELHYLLGKNAVDYSYVTGHGEHAYQNPHNRPTTCDNIELPMPGWVSGGPFKTPADEVARANIKVGTPPMKCYLDHYACYSLNEITIYWNSPAAFVTAYFNR